MMKRFYLALFFACFFFSINAHAGYIEVCTEFWERDYSPQNQGPEVESYTITYSCNYVWEDDSWWYDSGYSFGSEEQTPAPAEEPPVQTCFQVKADISAGQSACRVEARDWMVWKSEECNTGWNFNFAFSIGIKEWLGIDLDPDYTSGSDVGCSQSVLEAKQNAKLERCDQRANNLNTIIGSCSQYN